MSSSAIKKLRLNDSEDWNAWDREFGSKAQPTGSRKDINLQRTAQGTPSVALEEKSDPDGRPENANEMTTRGRTSYQLDWQIYSERLEKYDKEDKIIKELQGLDWGDGQPPSAHDCVPARRRSRRLVR
ncbi:uncharacterized protein C8A04DRAFT_31174 [Dichotomopilus funicola]|uniref:Uncharacterized protein n=1 Tax=Dichotomopilus funicola TaxID=1934379 RepID=A0AAN6ZKI0_9PEZI|nr:hypothetical protein C8A04DRAFT_31174 [Dichotomopilus funicola]